jgi:GNAT superfamily N-acetyltransferase
MTDIDISTDRGRLDLDTIHRFLSASYWSEGIPRDVVARSIRHSFCFGLYKDRRQIGFARVITDFTTFGYLSDVFVDPAEQGRGYGRRLIAAILNHEELRGLRRWHLVTRNAQPFYEELGFSRVVNPEGHMEIYHKPVYPGRGDEGRQQTAVNTDGP